MDIEIDTINVTVTGEDCNEHEIGRELQWYLSQALEEIAQDDLLMELEEEVFDELELPPIDWESEIDKTGKLIQLLKNALGDHTNAGK